LATTTGQDSRGRGRGSVEGSTSLKAMLMTEGDREEEAYSSRLLDVARAMGWPTEPRDKREGL
jgi:hypothetical protein